MAQSERVHPRTNRILQALVLAYQGIALIAFLIIPFLALNWMKTPFMGAFVEQTMVFNGEGQEKPAEAWGLYLDKSIGLKYQLIKVEDIQVTRQGQVSRALQGKHPGDPLTITIRRISDGKLEQRSITLSSFPVEARLAFFVIPYGVGLIFLATSLWIFGMRRAEGVGRGFAVFA